VNIHRACLVFMLFAGGGYAQIATTTSLVGTVTDSSGQVVPGTKVTATQTGTSDSYTAITNDLGYYSMDFVHIGSYTITVEHAGFQKTTKTGIVVEINQVVRTDFTLQVGTVTQSVVVEARAAVINTDDATVSQVIPTRQVAELPLNGRDPMQLATITPGVINGLKATNGVPPGEDFIGAGTREIQNSMALDGISIMNNLITTTPNRPMVESVSEVEVQTGTYSAQYGAYLGAHIDMITKSGSNQFHGALLEFVQNQIFNARGFFLPATQPKNPLRQNQFGFELDGPIVIPKLYNGRNKTFFMGSYEGLRLVSSAPQVFTILTPQMFQGNFSGVSTAIKNPVTGVAYQGNMIPASQLSPVSQKLQQYYPAPNLPGLTPNYAASVASNNNTDQTVDRIDQNLGDKTRLFFRYQRQQENLLTGASNVTQYTYTNVYISNYAIGYTQTITPNIVNDMRFGRNFFNSPSLNYFAVNNLTSAGAALGIPGFTGDIQFNNPGIPVMSISGFQGLGNASTNWYQDDTTWQGADQFSWTHGAHNIMAGVEFRKLETGRQATNDPQGIFTFTGQFSGYAPADFMTGYMANDTSAGPEIRGLVAEWRDGFFVLDKWQVSRKLTLNYGLRYELPTVPYTVNGNATELNAQQTAVVPANPPVKGFEFIYPNHNDWAPRIGYAYRLTEKTVVRGGLGIYYNPNQTNSFTFLNANPPFNILQTYTSLPTTPTCSFTNPFCGGAPPTFALGPIKYPLLTNMTTDNWNLPTARSNQWSTDVERQLWNGGGLDVGYLGSHMYHLDRSYYNNQPLLPGPGAIQPRRPNQLFGQIRTVQNDEIGNYNGLSITLRQRMTHGITLLSSYTWSHTLDVSSDSNGGGTPMNPYNWRLDYGNSNWDIRHRFQTSFVYDIPFFQNSNPVLNTVFAHWQANGIWTIQTGIPFNVSVSSDTANTNSNGTYRPNLIGTPSENCGDGHLSNCISTSTFALIPTGVYQYGSAGRNLLHGPPLFAMNLSFFKNFPIKERLRLQFRAELFNAFNEVNFANPNAVFGTSAFGTVGALNANVPNRVIQFGGKLLF